MPAPHHVSHSKFTNQIVLFDNGDFSVASGIYTEGDTTEFALGMRWNGHGTDPGYPHVVDNPVWFVVTPELAVPILNALARLPASNQDAIAAASQQLNVQHT